MMKNTINKYITIVVKDRTNDFVIGVGTLVIEKHMTGNVGFIENIVINKRA